MKKYLIALFYLIHSSCFATFYSQCGQDQYVYEKLFYNIKNGVFVDIGAHDGVRLSNTYFFETEQDWSGICIEPIPEVFAELQKNRKCILVNGCISDNEGQAQFMRIHGPVEVLEMLSGLIHKYDPRHLARVEYTLSLCGGSYEVTPVNCYLLNNLMLENGITHVNLLSIDTEGGELDILKTIDFKKFQIDVITVENNYGDASYAAFLKSKGFYLAASLQHDMLFVNKKFKAKAMRKKNLYE
jgi:FkbM family methyltransferase